MQFRVRPTTAADRAWIRKSIRARWGAEFVVAHGVVYYPHRLRGFVAETSRASRIGLATYGIESAACELVTLDSLQPGQGVGSALLQTVADVAAERGCRRLWCITTNDNLPAIRFYQRRGWRMVAVHPDAIACARARKPSIPRRGIDDIPIRDEIELELRLRPARSRKRIA